MQLNHLDTCDGVWATLADGGLALLRPLERGAEGPVLAVFDGLSPRSRELRFLTGVPRLAKHMLAALKREIPRHKVLLMPEGTTVEKVRSRADWGARTANIMAALWPERWTSLSTACRCRCAAPSRKRPRPQPAKPSQVSRRPARASTPAPRCTAQTA